jgi:hypothetical protein
MPAFAGMTEEAVFQRSLSGGADASTRAALTSSHTRVEHGAFPPLKAVFTSNNDFIFYDSIPQLRS